MPTDYVEDWAELYGRPVPTDGSIRPATETKVVTAPEKETPKASKTAEVK